MRIVAARMGWVVFCVFFVLPGCGSGSTPSSVSTTTGPTPPAPTVSALAISPGTDLMLIGASETFVATATLTDGSSRQVAPAWSSDNAAIVSIDSNGRATAQGAGIATLIARAEGRTASQAVRGLPDFAGNWRVQVRETACDVPPRWGRGFCNVSGLVTMTVTLARADRDRVVGSINNGIGWTGSATGQVAVDGTLQLSARLTSVRPTATFVSDYSDWRTRLSPTEGMTGSFREILTWIGERDQGFVAQDVVRATR